MDLTILIPAAGQSRRMRGRDKLVELIAGEPVLRRAVQLALSVTDHVIVALPEKSAPFYRSRYDCVADLTATLAHFPASANGLGGTVAGAVESLSNRNGKLMILLPDLVDLTRDDLLKVAEKTYDTPARGTDGRGAPGHPVVFPSACFDALLQTSHDDQGPRRVLSTFDVALVPLPNSHATLDLDTPEDWDAWRAARRT